MPSHLRLERWKSLLVPRYCRSWTYSNSYTQIARRVVANCTL